MAALDKHIIREMMKQKRYALSSNDYQRLSLSCFHLLIELEILQNAQNIAIYASTYNEVDTHLLFNYLQAQNKTILFPKVIAKQEMEFYEVKDKNDLQIGHFQILEPKPTCEKSQQIDLMIVPLVAYNKQGYRIGMGQGYYDRYLASFPTTTCGLAFGFQSVDFVADSFDVPLDYICNENGIDAFIHNNV